MSSAISPGSAGSSDMPRTRTGLVLLAALTLAPLASAAEPPPVKLVIKPLLCVLDKTATTCAITFDIRWKSTEPADYCLADSVSPQPLRCWQRTAAGEMKHPRRFAEDFAFWLAPPAGDTRLAEVKIEVLRLGSKDRRRERRTRHVWDVL
jgi:hypothetical protein